MTSVSESTEANLPISQFPVPFPVHSTRHFSRIFLRPTLFCLLPCRETLKFSQPSEAHSKGLKKIQHGFIDKEHLKSKQLENSAYAVPSWEIPMHIAQKRP